MSDSEIFYIITILYSGVWTMRKSAKKKPENDIRSFSVKFMMNYDNSVIMTAADDNYLMLEGCAKEDIGKNIRDVLGKEDCKRLKFYFDSYRGHEFQLKYIKRFTKSDNLLWSVNAKINYPNMYCDAQRLEDSGNSLYTKETEAFSEQYGVMILKKTEKSYHIEYASDFIYNMTNGKNDVYIDDILEGEETQKRFERILDRCIVKNLPFEGYVKTTFKKYGEVVGHIRIKPFTKNGDYCAAVSISERNENTPSASVPYSMNISEKISGKYFFGCGIIDCSLHDHIYFYDINPYLADLISKGRISKSVIVNSYPFKSALCQKTSFFGMINSPDITGKEHYRYFIGAVPVIMGNEAVRMLIFLIPSENHNIMDESLLGVLTPRESNVLRLAAEGMDNKCIASLLNISDGTAKRELFCCYQKLNVKNKTEALLKMYHLI